MPDRERIIQRAIAAANDRWLTRPLTGTDESMVTYIARMAAESVLAQIAETNMSKVTIKRITPQREVEALNRAHVPRDD